MEQFNTVRKSLEPMDVALAQQSVHLLNEAILERFPDRASAKVIVWLGDIHIHKNTAYGHSVGSIYVDKVDTQRQFQLALKEVEALQPAPNVLILGGDMTDYSYPEEWRMFRQLLDQSSYTFPILPAFGNHDNANRDPKWVGERQLAEIWEEVKQQEWSSLTAGELYYEAIHDGIKFIVLDAQREDYYTISKQQKEWLREVLTQTTIPTIVICHVHQLQVGSFLDLGSIIRDKELYKIIASSAFVLGVFSGHVHLTKLWQYREKLFGTFPSVAYGIGSSTGWGGVIVQDERIEAVFYKELYGSTYDYYKGVTHQSGKFTFAQPDLFQNSPLCSPSYWPWEEDPNLRS